MHCIFPMLTIIFLGYFGFSLGIPLFSPLFLNPNAHFLPLETTQQMRQILLGVLLAMYPIGQFIGAPILGKWSDKYGRKPVLLISLLFLIPFYLMSAFAIVCVQPLLLFISRLFSGLLAGDLVIAQVAVADASKDLTEKTKNFGKLMSFGSVAFFLGPLVGGMLADSKIVAWFRYETPFFCIAVFSLVSFIVVAIFFHETHEADPDVEVSLRRLFFIFVEGLKPLNLRILFMANFFLFLAIFLFLSFFSPYLVTVYHFSSASLGKINAYLSIPMIFAPVVCKHFTKLWSPRQIVQLGSCCLGMSYMIFMLSPFPWSLFFALIPISFFIAVGFIFSPIIISNAADQHVQGAALGVNQSILVLAEALTACIGGVSMTVFTTLPFCLALVFAFVVALILIYNQKSCHTVK